MMQRITAIRQDYPGHRQDRRRCGLLLRHRAIFLRLTPMCKRVKREELIEGINAWKELFPVRLGPVAIACSVLLALISVL